MFQKGYASCSSLPAADARSCNDPLVEDNGLKSTVVTMVRNMPLANTICEHHLRNLPLANLYEIDH
jgi:hypothetical protein